MIQSFLIRFGWLFLIVLGAGLSVCFYQIGFSKVSGQSAEMQFSYYVAAFGCYALMVLYIHFFWGKRYLSLELIILFALLIRAFLLWHDPLFDDSNYRHAWDGRIYSAGVHPYSEFPSSERLRGFRDEVIYPKVAGQESISPSSPIALEFYRFIALFSDHPFIYRVVIVVLDVAIIFILIGLLRLMNRATAWVTVYAWNPIVVIESASHGHEMILAVFLFVVALNFALRYRPLYGSIFISLAVSVHWLYLSILPFFEDIRSRWKTWMGMILIATGILFFIYEGFALSWLPVWHHLAAVHWGAETNSGLFFAVMKLTGLWTHSIEESFLMATVGSWMIGLTGLTVLLYRYWKKSYATQKQLMIRFVYGITGLGLFVSPVVTPVWLLTMLPVLCLVPSGPWILFSGCVGIYYFREIPFLSEMLEGVHIWRLYEYLPFYVWLIISAFIWWKRRNRSFYSRETV